MRQQPTAMAPSRQQCGLLGVVRPCSARWLAWLGLVAVSLSAAWLMSIGVTGFLSQSALAASTGESDAYYASTLLDCDLPGRSDDTQCYDPPVLPRSDPLSSRRAGLPP